MKKYIIVGVVVIIGILAILFLIQNRRSLNKEFTVAGNDLAVTPKTENETKIINSLDNKKIMNVTLNTNMGDITIEFLGELAPNTVANFVKLAQEHFYNGVKFHRVIKGFMIQGGDQ